jgi:predicted porin
MKASFTISSPFDSDTNSSGFNFGGRGMIVGISGGFGAIDLGRSPGNMGNSIMASGFNGNIGNLGVEDSRPNNSISYKTPSMGGFTGRVLYGIGDEDAADTSKGKQVEISGEYKAGALLARVSQASHTEATGSNDKTETGLQVNYDLGMAAVNVRYMKMDVDGGNASDTTRTGVGVNVPLGSGLSAMVDHWTYDANGSTADYSVTTAGVVKSLSKRTNVYAVYATADTKSGATGNSGNQINAGLAGKDPSVLAIGVRHSF